MIVLNSQLRNQIDENEFTRRSDSLVDEDFFVENTGTSSAQNDKNLIRDKRSEQDNANHQEGEYSVEKSWAFTSSIQNQVICAVVGYLTALIHLNEKEDVYRLNLNLILLLSKNCQLIATMMIIITSIMGTIYLFTYLIQRQREQKWRINHQMCRTEMQTLLGSIGAANIVPLESFYREDKLNIWKVFFRWKEFTKREEFDRKIEKFARCHVQFLTTIDTSIHMIRIATSIQLGLGPSSLSIDRVEKCSIHKRKTKPNVKRVRETTFSVLSKEMKSLRLIWEKASLCVSDDYEVAELIASMNFSNTDDELIEESLKSSHLLSTSFLKQLRKTAGDLLSETIMMCLFVSTKMPVSDNNEVIDGIKLSTALIEELEIYVQSFLLSGKVHHDSDETDSEMQKLMSRISTHLDIIQSAAWTCHQSLFDHKDNKWDLSTNTEMKFLWKYLGNEIENLVDWYQSINSMQFQSAHEESLEDDIDECIHEIERTADKIEYDDEGLQCLERNQSQDSSVKNKILVFSGKGVKSTRKSTHKEKTFNCENKVLSNLPLPFFGERSDRNMLLKELQNRLEMLEKVEEWDAVENRSCTEDEEKESAALLLKRKANLNNKSPISFLGVQGCLLSELQDAISKNSDRQN